MPDYKKMYTNLFNKITDVIEELQAVQQETEELYTQSAEPEHIVIEPKTGEDSADKKSAPVGAEECENI